MISKEFLKKAILVFFRFWGLEFSLYKPHTSNSAQISGVLQHYDISLVLDVGANIGQYYSELRFLRYTGEVMSFEPTVEAYNVLKKKNRGDSKWIIHQRAALGSYDGETSINVAGNSVSSSILPMEDKHVNAEPSSGYIRSEAVPVQKLDTVLNGYDKAGKRIFLKIDTQGFEYEVLKGAENTLPACTFVQLEMSFHSLYAGQKTFLELYDYMKKFDFEVFSIFREFLNTDTLESMQYNVLFINNKKRLQ